MAEDRELISQAEYARRRGVSRAAVNKAVHSGRISTVKTEQGDKIDPEIADREWQDNTMHQNARTKEQADNRSVKDEPSLATKIDGTEERAEKQKSPYALARGIREGFLARIAELEYNQKIGKLVDADQVRTEAFNMARTVRNAFLAMPDRLAGMLAATDQEDECYKILTDEVVKILENLVDSNGK